MSVCYRLSAINVKTIQFFPCLAQGHMQYHLLCVFFMTYSTALSLSVFIPSCQTAAAHGDFASFVLSVCVSVCLFYDSGLKGAISHECVWMTASSGTAFARVDFLKEASSKSIAS